MKQEKYLKKINTSVMKLVFSIAFVAIVFVNCLCVYATETFNILDCFESNNSSDITALINDNSIIISDTSSNVNGSRLNLTNTTTKHYQFTISGSITRNINSSGTYFVMGIIADNYSQNSWTSYSGSTQIISNETLNIYVGNAGTYNFTASYDGYIKGLSLNAGTYGISSVEYEFTEMIIDGVEQTEGDDGFNINYTLPIGNAIFLEVGDNFNGVNLATIMEVPSTLGVVNSNPWPYSTQLWYQTDTIPANGTNLYNVGASKIEWSKSNNASTNLLDQTNYAVWQTEGPLQNKKYFCIINPYYYGDNVASSGHNNGSVTIVATGIKSMTVVPLRTSMTTEGNTTTVTTNIDGGQYTTTVPEDFTDPIVWEDPDGGSTAPGVSSSNTPSTGVSQFQGWLQGFLDEIVEIFAPAHNAISTLASTISNFASWMQALYIWLPSPILNLLTAAISLAIVIGVIKVFI